MEHCEFILIALVLLIVFCGMQVPKLIALLGNKRPNLESVKTVISASKPVQTPRKVTSVSERKAVAPVKKTVQVKKATAKRPIAKKSAPKKKTAKK